jgi:hypothetical protein
MSLPKFLKLFIGEPMSLEFKRLQNKISVAKATIIHQTGLIAQRDARITELLAKIDSMAAAAPSDITDADLAEEVKGLDELFAVTPVLKPVEVPAPAPAPVEPVVVAPTPRPDADTIPATLAIDGLAHPSRQD